MSNFCWSRISKLEARLSWKPQQNAFIESCNGKCRGEFLNEHIFQNLEHTENLLKIWFKDYNEDRPHFALRNKTPKNFLEDFIEKEKNLSGRQAETTETLALVPAHFQRFGRESLTELQKTKETELDGMKIMILKPNKAYNLSYKTITDAKDPNLRFMKKAVKVTAIMLCGLLL